MGKGSMPRHETILKIRHGVAVGMFDEWKCRFCRDAFPRERIMAREPRQRADIVDDAQAIQVLEQAEAHMRRT